MANTNGNGDNAAITSDIIGVTGLNSCDKPDVKSDVAVVNDKSNNAKSDVKSGNVTKKQLDKALKLLSTVPSPEIKLTKFAAVEKLKTSIKTWLDAGQSIRQIAQCLKSAEIDIQEQVLAIYLKKLGIYEPKARARRTAEEWERYAAEKVEKIAAREVERQAIAAAKQKLRASGSPQTQTDSVKDNIVNGAEATGLNTPGNNPTTASKIAGGKWADKKQFLDRNKPNGG
jgi:DNA-binding transcriptional MerR regulator